MARKLMATLALAAAGFGAGTLTVWVLALCLGWMVSIPTLVRAQPWVVGGVPGLLLGAWSARHAAASLRIAAITLGLMVMGFVAGGAAAMVMMAAWRPYRDDVLDAGLFGGVAGMVLGPLLAWMLMRHVPIWLAVAGTMLGTVAGWMLGLFLWDWGNAYGMAFVGFVTAALVLRFRTPRRAIARAPQGV